MISVGYFVLSGYALDTADASQVECVEPSFLPGIMIQWPIQGGGPGGPGPPLFKIPKMTKRVPPVGNPQKSKRGPPF